MAGAGKKRTDPEAAGVEIVRYDRAMLESHEVPAGRDGGRA